MFLGILLGGEVEVILLLVQFAHGAAARFALAGFVAQPSEPPVYPGIEQPHEEGEDEAAGQQERTECHQSFVLLVGPFAGIAGHDPQHGKEQDVRDNERHGEVDVEDASPVYFQPLCLLRGGNLLDCRRVGEYAADGRDAVEHTLVVVPLLESGQDILRLYAFADGVGQDTFQSVAGAEDDAPLVEHEQYEQSVVVLLADAPPGEEVGGEEVGRGVANRFESYDSHLRGVDPLQVEEHLVEPGHGFGREYAVGVAHKPAAVGLVDVGHLLGRISGRTQQGDKEQKQEDRADSFFHEGIRV